MDRYLVQDVIGLGGMGAVYRARDLHFPNVVRLVAVKEMINQASDPVLRQTIVQNFEREANILVTLSHPSITKILDFFTYAERSYLVLEYIHGKDLEALLSSTPEFFPEDQVIAWAIELCDVLHFLHTHKPEPIIFRDMKPSNVMINQQTHVILVDFGIAKIFKSGQKGTMIGTEGYSPPEQYRGEASPMADIYALGATLHHVLTKRDPRLEAPFTFAERPIRQINPNVSLEMETLVNTALQYNPEERFQTAHAMKEALLVVARKTGALSRVALRTGPLAHEQTVKPLWTFKCEDEIRSSPICDGNAVYVGAYDHNVYAINATNGEFLWKYPTEGGIVSRPTISDGVIYFGSEDHRLYALLSRSGRLSWAYDTEGPIRSSPRIFEGHVLIGSDDGFLHAVNILSTRISWKVDVGKAIRSSPSVGGDMIYFGDEDGDLQCCDLRGQIRWRFRAKRAITSSPLIVQGVVYVTSMDGTFYAVDAKSGWAIWRFRMGKASVSSPCMTDNYLYAGSADGNIYCIEATNAKEIWRFKTDHQVSGSPIVYKDALYCGSADGNFYCLEYKTGRLRWKFSTGGAITGTPVVHNDVLYIGSSDHILYALLP
ncbi:MAG: serine/threonine-protein kinase [Anaerolineaceae bacterium]|nr:serine/threonine-protein kinase [Anaerolineaceae bacterium]